VGLLRWTGIGIACALTTGGCARKAPPPAPAAKKPAGRLVPAVLASFERGPGGWKSTPAATGDASLEAPVTAEGGAAKGERWLAQAVTVAPGQTRTLNVYGVVPARDWSRFGNTVRASVRAVPAGKVTARLYLSSPFAKETDGPDRDVSGDWTTLVWNAGDAVHEVSRIGVRFTVTGPWRGRLGLDNVRIGAEDALTTAYSVAYGPYDSREKAVDGMNALKTSGIESFPLYEQGWYLNLGTFSTRKSAHDEAKRLGDRGLKTTILVR
jgi:hypothetical protein